MPHWIATEPDVACRVQKNACRLAALGYKCSLNHVPFHLPVTWLLAAVVPWALPVGAAPFVREPFEPVFGDVDIFAGGGVAG